MLTPRCARDLANRPSPTGADSASKPAKGKEPPIVRNVWVALFRGINVGGNNLLSIRLLGRGRDGSQLAHRCKLRDLVQGLG